MTRRKDLCSVTGTLVGLLYMRGDVSDVVRFALVLRVSDPPFVHSPLWPNPPRPWKKGDEFYSAGGSVRPRHSQQACTETVRERRIEKVLFSTYDKGEAQ